jgi:hypothetical protein
MGGMPNIASRFYLPHLITNQRSLTTIHLEEAKMPFQQNKMSS